MTTELEKFLFEEVQRQKKRIKRLEHKAKVANEMIDYYRRYAVTTATDTNNLISIPQVVEASLRLSKQHLESTLRVVNSSISKAEYFNDKVTHPSAYYPVYDAQAERKRKKGEALQPKSKPQAQQESEVKRNDTAAS